MRIWILSAGQREAVFGEGLRTSFEARGVPCPRGWIYPVLHQLREAELLDCHERFVDGRARKYYRTTPSGSRLLVAARLKILELSDEIVPDTRGRHPATPARLTAEGA